LKFVAFEHYSQFCTQLQYIRHHHLLLLVDIDLVHFNKNVVRGPSVLYNVMPQ